MSPLASPPPSPPAWVAPGPARPAAEAHSAAFARLWAQAKAVRKREAWLPGPGGREDQGGVPPLAGGPRWRPLALEAPPGLGEGAQLAQDDLRKLLARLGQRPQRACAPGHAQAGPQELVVELRPNPNLPPQAGSYRIALRPDGPGARLVLEAKDALGWGYACRRAMAWLGWRPFHYLEAHAPEARPDGLVALPAFGAVEAWRPDKAFRIRAFAPHLYHPCALSLAVHTPGPAGLAHVEAYLDWLVATRQNMAVFLLLERDAPNRFWPVPRPNRPWAQALTPHWKAIVQACHRRGLQARANVALANYVSRNAYAIHPGSAILQNLGLAGLRSAGWASAEAIAFQQAREASRPQLEGAIDGWMAAGWDGIVWNMGTSEFSPTDGPLTLAWLSDAASHLAKRWPGTAMAANSHVPLRPWAPALNESYYNLLRFAPPAVGSWSHTVQAYALTDPAPVYGGQDFAHKLRLLAAGTPEREDVYYPETSYWVSNDASVPLFLPAYALNRAHDAAILRLLPDLDGWATFTTAWEGGYWLNDLLSAELAARPRAGLGAHLGEAMAPWGEQREVAKGIVADWMHLEQALLYEKGLIRDLQGFDALSEFGAQARRTPLVNRLLEGTNNVPERTRLRALRAQGLAALQAHQQGPLADLAQFSDRAQELSEAWWALGPACPPAIRRVHRELGLAMATTACRAKQVLSAHLAFHLDAQARLGAQAPAQRPGRNRAWAEGLRQQARDLAWAEALRQTDKAHGLVRQAEALYRDPPQVAFGKAQGPTLWNDRLLSPVHTGRYWHHTMQEVAELIGEKPPLPWPEGPTLPPGSGAP